MLERTWIQTYHSIIFVHGFRKNFRNNIFLTKSTIIVRVNIFIFSQFGAKITNKKFHKKSLYKKSKLPDWAQKGSSNTIYFYVVEKSDISIPLNSKDLSVEEITEHGLP